jgi:hypothetical protein
MQPTIFFTMIPLGAIMMGGLIGARSGFKLFGYPGGAVGAVVGTALGFLVGYGFHRSLCLSMERRVRRKSTPALRAELVDDDIPGTYVSSLIISVLLERHEPVESFRGYILNQLRSEYVTWRTAGLRNLEICYPDLAAKLGNFDPFHPNKDALERLNEIDSAIDLP